ncbi:hypothetical protein Vafri_10726 [Volvox africanus]|uniref:Mitochondrial carrier protein n=1 Tax=Volvox africanus TaxID=51714 RepID=A0A8J4BAX3_9CHLO|nr:hypothetical protein Vafri_10726 [Volvox africanus]
MWSAASAVLRGAPMLMMNFPETHFPGLLGGQAALSTAPNRCTAWRHPRPSRHRSFAEALQSILTVGGHGRRALGSSLLAAWHQPHLPAFIPPSPKPPPLRGVLGAAGGAGIIIGAFFAFYSTSKRLLREKTDLSEGTVAFIAGAMAAVGSSVVKVPIAVCIRSVQAGVYPNALVAATSVVQKAGFRGLFTGFLPTLLEDVPDMAVKFAVYETLRAVHMQLHHQERPSTLEDLVMGGVAGSAAAAATTPLDVVKTRMMCNASERPTVLQAARGILAECPGPGSFFRGVGPRALSNGLNSAIFYMWFELLRSKIREALDNRQQRQQQLAAGQAIPALLVGKNGAASRYEGLQEREGPQQPHVEVVKPRSGPGHQAVASCSLRWISRPLWRGDAVGDIATSRTGDLDAYGDSGEMLNVNNGCRNLRTLASDGHSVPQPVTSGSSGPMACLSLAVPLLGGGLGGLRVSG